MLSGEIFKNYPLDTDSFDGDWLDKHNHDLFGGHDVKNFPSGGFPPIYICDRDYDRNRTSDDKEKNNIDKIIKEYKTHKTAVSIKSLLEKKKETAPFILAKHQ